MITDASNAGIGAILAQKDSEGKTKIISYYSKSLDSSEKNYSITDKELLALVKSVLHYRAYLLGRKFKIHTDHQALKYMKQAKSLNSRLMRWSLLLQDFDFEIEYIKGKDNAADALSRCFMIQSNPHFQKMRNVNYSKNIT